MRKHFMGYLSCGESVNNHSGPKSSCFRINRAYSQNNIVKNLARNEVGYIYRVPKNSTQMNSSVWNGIHISENNWLLSEIICFKILDVWYYYNEIWLLVFAQLHTRSIGFAHAALLTSRRVKMAPVNQHSSAKVCSLVH